MPGLPRNQMVKQSVEDYVTDALDAEYDDSDVVLIDDFPTEATRETELDKNTIAPGFTFDRTGVQAEVGSGLRVRPYNIEFFVFGLTDTWSENLAGYIEETLDNEYGLIPLKDPETEDVLDQLLVQSVTSNKQVLQDPRPWEENCWVVTLSLTDEYYARA